MAMQHSLEEAMEYGRIVAVRAVTGCVRRVDPVMS